jgi:hypothetical protein
MLARVILGAATLLALPSPSLADEIHACVGPAGRLRIVASPAQCVPAEHALSWNQSGPAGPEGPEGPAGPSGSQARANLVGFSTATFTGSAGLLAFSLACQADFPGSRVCTSLDIAESTALPTALTGLAWVRPAALPSGTSSSIIDLASLREGSGQHCGSWTNGSDSNFGLVVVLQSSTANLPELAPYSGLLTERCNVSLPAACCALQQ